MQSSVTERSLSRSSRAFPAFAAGCACLGLIVVLLSTSLVGPAVSADSAAYLAAAEHIAAGEGFRLYDGQILTNFAPLYSVILAVLLRLFGVDPLISSRIISALAFVAVILLAAYLLRRQFSDWPVLAYIGTAWVLFSWPLLQVSVWAWTEPLFLVFELLFFIILIRYAEKPSGRPVAWLSLIGAVACLTRYLGVTLIATAALIVLLNPRLRPWDRLRHALVFGLATSLPVVLWWVRNLAVANVAFGSRAGSQVGLQRNIGALFDTAWGWFLPIQLGPTVLHVILLGCLLCLGLVMAVRRRAWRAPEATPLVVSAALFSAIYVLALMASAASAEVNPVDDRLLSPIAVPVVILVLAILMAAYRALRPRYGAVRLRNLLLALFIVWLAFPVARYTKATDGRMRYGAGGYFKPVWLQSELMHYVATSPFWGEAPVYSNRADAIYLLTGQSATLSPAKKTTFMGRARPNLADPLDPWPAKTPAYLVWFDDPGRSYVYTLRELQASHQLTLEQRFADGAVYRIER